VAEFVVSREVAAPPEAVFETITDHRRYPEFTPLRAARLERQGSEAANGVGAIRALTLAGPPIREEVIAYEPPSLFAYRLLSGLPLRDHVGTVRIEPAAGGSRIDYRIETTPTVPLAGPLLVGGLRLGTARLLGWVAGEAERRDGR
jgi:uncharacterized protein YndB with AHSA1/START domain